MVTNVVRLADDDFEQSLAEAAKIIKSGGLVVFPTETVYGLGADGTNPDAAVSIYKAKGRPADNPLILHIADPKDAEEYTYTSEAFYRLAEAFMPGPLTVVMPSKPSVPKETRAGLDTVAVRCPADKIANKLIRMAGVPIAAPSANLSGSPSPTCSRHVIDDMLGRVDMIIDGGNCDFGLESTIVKIVSDKELLLLRPGKITPEDLRECGFSVEIASAVTGALKEGEKPLSPGMKYRHYAPKAPVFLFEGNGSELVSHLKNEASSKVGLIWYSEEIEEITSAFPDITVLDFGSKCDLNAQAHNLFEILRRADEYGFERIYAPLPEKSGIALALYNRMIRAAAHQIIRK